MEHGFSKSIKWLIQLQMLLLLLFFNCTLILGASFIDYPSANVTNSWLNYPYTTWKFSDHTFFRPVLALGRDGFPDLGFGFFNNGTSSTYYLTILKIPNKVDSTFTNYAYPPIVLWSANGEYPVRENATLQLNRGELLLIDVDRNIVWSANNSALAPGNVSRASIARLELFPDGNLKLVNDRNGVIWQSFDYPTNTWLPRQSLVMRQRVSSSTSKYNLARGSFYFRPLNGAIRAFVGVWPGELQQYGNIFEFNKINTYSFGIGSFHRYGNFVNYEAQNPEFQYIRLEPNGHLNVFGYVDGYKETLYSDLFANGNLGECAYPTVCGRYAVCNNSSCTCAGEGSGNIFFRPLNASQPNLGCAEINPLTCQDSGLHTFLELHNVSYFRYNDSRSNIDPDKCKEECLRNCSCKGVVFRYQDDISVGGCFFPRDIYSLIATAGAKTELPYKAITFIKVQMPRTSKKKSSGLPLVVLIPSVFSGLAFFVFLGACYYVKKRSKNNESPDNISSIYGSRLVRKFTFDALRAATQDFEIKLGSGGFGSVYLGTLEDGSKVAVKQLNHQGTKDFTAEVETIGRVHHVNLVKLIGYCSDSSNKLLVYEYLINGSLDSWIFNKELAHALNWEKRREIIIGIARGLEYLHIHCNPHIIHFDIKPQNILLDEEFKVKISDFGLAKLIGGNQIQMSILPKGTPGYIAPELFRGRHATVQVDAYSYGIVVLEIVCGRKCSDNSQGEFLIEAVKRSALEGRLFELVDDSNEDMQSHREEAVKAMELAISCLQPRDVRPYMSAVVKILEGFVDMNPLSDYSFLSLYPEEPSSELSLAEERGSVSLVPEVLSGPR